MKYKVCRISAEYDTVMRDKNKMRRGEIIISLSFIQKASGKQFKFDSNLDFDKDNVKCFLSF